MSFTTYRARVGWRATRVVFVLVCRHWDDGVLFEDPLFSESISAIARTMGPQFQAKIQFRFTRSMMLTPSSRLKSRPVGTRLFSSFFLVLRMRLAEAVKVKYIDTKQASPTSLALGWLAWVLLQNRTRVARIQTVLAFTAETPDLG
jgi:hypothetical protein